MCPAADLQALGLSRDALNLLGGYVNPPRRVTRQWQRPFQDVMCLLIDLCVGLKESSDNMKVLKDSLHQYRSLTQQVGGGFGGLGRRCLPALPIYSVLHCGSFALTLADGGGVPVLRRDVRHPSGDQDDWGEGGGVRGRWARRPSRG